MAGPGLSLKARALRYLAQREHSRAELARKLVRHVGERPAAAGGAEGPEGGDGGAEPALDADERIARVLDDLAAAGLLDDHRAAEALVGAQSRRFGVARLRQVLRERGLPPEVAAEALAGVAGSELARAQEVWRRRFGAPAPDAAGRAKQARFLAGRGFGADVIRQVVRGLGDDAD